MLTPLATRKVCLEAQPGRGEEGGRFGGVVGCKSIKNEMQPGIPLCVGAERHGRG